MKKLSTRSVPELKMIARERGVELADGMKKAEIVAALEGGGEDNVITVNTVSPSGETSANVDDNNVLISPHKNLKKKEIVEEEPHKQPDKIALWAQRNLAWSGVGKLDKGYNFVTRGVADKWIGHKAVRIATPEEVASHYGIN